MEFSTLRSQTITLSTVRTWQACQSVAIDSDPHVYLPSELGNHFYIRALILNNILRDAERSLLGSPNSLAVTHYCRKLTVKFKF